MLKLTFHGGAKSVTGANYLLEGTDGAGVSTRVLIDCGLEQGSNFSEKHNWDPFPYDVKSIDAVFITHAHIDHTGRLPKLAKDGFRGKIYSNPATREAAEILLHDSEHILEESAKKLKMPKLYSKVDVDAVMPLWEGIEYHQAMTVGPFTITLYNAGHVLGSAFLVFEYEDEKIVFSGDLGNSPAPIIGAWETFTGGATYCVIESTYGNRVHERVEERKSILEDAIEDTVLAGGTLMIPAFAMERTQELLYELNDLVEHGRVPKIQVFVDSPLAIKLTEIYRRHSKYFTDEAKKEMQEHGSLFFFPGLTMTATTVESKKINDVQGPKVVIAGSGMSHGGRILHHEKRYLPDPKSMLLIVGYQAVGSMGREIFDGADTVKIQGEVVPVRAKVKAVGAYSAHADQPQLLAWLTAMRGTLKKTFVVQGEEEASNVLAQKISDELVVHSRVPEKGEEVIL